MINVLLCRAAPGDMWRTGANVRKRAEVHQVERQALRINFQQLRQFWYEWRQLRCRCSCHSRARRLRWIPVGLFLLGKRLEWQCWGVQLTVLLNLDAMVMCEVERSWRRCELQVRQSALQWLCGRPGAQRALQFGLAGGRVCPAASCVRWHGGRGSLMCRSQRRGRMLCITRLHKHRLSCVSVGNRSLSCQPGDREEVLCIKRGFQMTRG